MCVYVVDITFCRHKGGLLKGPRLETEGVEDMGRWIVHRKVVVVGRCVSVCV